MTKKVFFSPHPGDATRFGAFTLQRERPLVVTLADAAAEGRMEDRLAMEILGVNFMDFCGLDDMNLGALRRVMAAYGHATQVWAPLPERGGDPGANAVGKLAAEMFPGMVTFYLATRLGKPKGVPVPVEPRWVAAKLRALACYETRIAAETERFLGAQHEFYAEDRAWKAILEGRNWGNQ